MNNKAEALMPCPFCGSYDTDDSYSVATRTDTGDKIYYGVGCNTCGCQTETFESKHEAIKAWNTRKGCAEIAREAVDSTQGTIMSVRKHGYEREYVLKSKAKHEINKAFGVSDESPVTPYEQKITCSKCGIDFSGTTGYVCSNTDCPMGLNGTTC